MKLPGALNCHPAIAANGGDSYCPAGQPQGAAQLSPLTDSEALSTARSAGAGDVELSLNLQAMLRNCIEEHAFPQFHRQAQQQQYKAANQQAPVRSVSWQRCCRSCLFCF